MSLYPREWEYLRLRASGLSQQEVADRMGVAFQTAKNHQTAIGHKVLGPGGGTLVDVLRAVGWLVIPSAEPPQNRPKPANIDKNGAI